jgi:hypothetical protein
MLGSVSEFDARLRKPSPTTESRMDTRSRFIGIALVALTVALPANSAAQWTRSNVNGQEVLDQDGQGFHQRALLTKYGWYQEITYYSANRAVTAMTFSVPQSQASERMDHVSDTNGDGWMDTGYTWVVGRGWQQWVIPAELSPYKVFLDQARMQYQVRMGTAEQEIYRILFVRAEKFYQVADRTIRARYPAR